MENKDCITDRDLRERVEKLNAVITDKITEVKDLRFKWGLTGAVLLVLITIIYFVFVIEIRKALIIDYIAMPFLAGLFIFFMVFGKTFNLSRAIGLLVVAFGFMLYLAYYLFRLSTIPGSFFLSHMFSQDADACLVYLALFFCVFAALYSSVRTTKVFPSSRANAVAGVFFLLAALTALGFIYAVMPYDMLPHIPEFQLNPATTIFSILALLALLSFSLMTITWLVKLFIRKREKKDKLTRITLKLGRAGGLLSFIAALYVVEGHALLMVFSGIFDGELFMMLLSTAILFAAAAFTVLAGVFSFFSLISERKWRKAADEELVRLRTELGGSSEA